MIQLKTELRGFRFTVFWVHQHQDGFLGVELVTSGGDMPSKQDIVDLAHATFERNMSKQKGHKFEVAKDELGLAITEIYEFPSADDYFAWIGHTPKED